MNKFIRNGKVIFEVFPAGHPKAGKADPESAQAFPSMNKAKRHSRTVCGLGNVRKGE